MALDLPLRPTVFEVSLDSIERNVRSIKRKVGNAKVMAVLKADAYGHGLIGCARFFEQLGVDYLGVAFVEEGVALRRASIRTPILVLGGVFPGQVKYFLQHQLDLTASSIFKLNAINSAAQDLGVVARVHLKVDTGMERIGVHYYNAASFFDAAYCSKNIEVVGVFSHFACASMEDRSVTTQQMQRFCESLEYFPKHGLPYPLRHIANSAGLLADANSYLDLVRPGLALYGVYPAQHLRDVLPLEAAGTLRSQIVYFKVVRNGAGVSYDHTWVASEDTRVVTIPIGYGDGYSVRLSNVGSVLIRGKRYPIIGRICMDQLMVNIGHDEAFNGEDVVLLGSQGGENISAEELGVSAGSSCYEILTSIAQRVPRQYYWHNQDVTDNLLSSTYVKLKSDRTVI